MESRYVQLTYGVVKDESKEKTNQLNLPPNYKKHILFDKLPYYIQLENPTLNDVIKNGVNDKLNDTALR